MLHYEVLKFLLSFTIVNIYIIICQSEYSSEVIINDLSTDIQAVIGNCSTKLCHYSVEECTTPCEDTKFDANVLISPVLDPVIYIQINVDPKNKVSFNSKQNFTEQQPCPACSCPSTKDQCCECRTKTSGNGYYMRPNTMRNGLDPVEEPQNPITTWVENYKNNNKNLATLLQWLQTLKHADRIVDKSKSKDIEGEKLFNDQNGFFKRLLVASNKSRREKNRPLWPGNNATRSIERFKNFLSDQQKRNHEKDKRLNKDFEQNLRNLHDLQCLVHKYNNNSRKSDYRDDNNIDSNFNDDYEEIALKRLMSTVLKPISRKGKHDISCYNVYPLLRATNSGIQKIQENMKKRERDTENTIREREQDESSVENNGLQQGLNSWHRHLRDNNNRFQTKKGKDSSKNEDNKYNIISINRNKKCRKGKKKLLKSYDQNENNISNVTSAELPIVFAVIKNFTPNSANINPTNKDFEKTNDDSIDDFELKYDSEFYKIEPALTQHGITEVTDKTNKRRLSDEAETTVNAKGFKMSRSTSNSNGESRANKKIMNKNGKKKIIEKPLVKNYYSISKPNKNNAKEQDGRSSRIQFDKSTLDDIYDDYKNDNQKINDVKKKKDKSSKNPHLNDTDNENKTKCFNANNSKSSPISLTQLTSGINGGTTYAYETKIVYVMKHLPDSYQNNKSKEKVNISTPASALFEYTQNTQHDNMKSGKFMFSVQRYQSPSMLKYRETLSSFYDKILSSSLNLYTPEEGNIIATTQFFENTPSKQTHYTETGHGHTTPIRMVYNAYKKKKKKIYSKSKRSTNELNNNSQTICQKPSEELVGYSTMTFLCEETTVNLRNSQVSE